MAAKSVIRISIYVPAILILLLATTNIHRSSSSSLHPRETPINDDRVVVSKSKRGPIRSLLSNRRNVRIPSCFETILRSQCSQYVKCRWCRSEVLDDMCFSKLEARRLPQQVRIESTQ